MYVELADISVATPDLDDYVAARRDHTNPLMKEQPGFGGTVLLRPREGDNPVQLALLNWWESVAHLQHWVNSPERDETPADVAHLVQALEYSLYGRHDDCSVTVGDPAAAGMCSIGVQRTISGRGRDYLDRRRDIANPSVQEAPGFVGVSVYSAPHQEDAFMVFFQWESDAAADAYYASPEHAGPVYDAIAGVLAHRPGSRRYDVLLCDVPVFQGQP
jgi:heme-degrading monooxygenase HmoA